MPDPNAIERWIASYLHVVRATTHYRDPKQPQTYHNLWLVTLDPGGRAREFVEYWMLQKERG